jgi:amphi-Trp domain-containing protein
MQRRRRVKKQESCGIFFTGLIPTPKGSTTMTKKPDRDIEKSYSTKQMIEKLRRLADCLEQNKPFKIQIAGERITIPARAVFNIEHEREGDAEEVEFQFKWHLK